MPGTSVYSVVFYAGVCIAGLFAGNYLYGVWKTFITGFQKARDESTSVPLWIIPTIQTIVVVTVFVVFYNLGWNVMQGLTTHSSHYENPAEVAGQKVLQESVLPGSDALDSTRMEQKYRSEVKPHEDALKSFDASMQQEAQKIQERNGK